MTKRARRSGFGFQQTTGSQFLNVNFPASGIFESSNIRPSRQWARPDIKAGRALAQKLFARCHAIGPGGPSPLAKAPPFRTFASKWPLENLEEALGEGILVVHEAMPEFTLDPYQIADLLGFIATLPDE